MYDIVTSVIFIDPGDRRWVGMWWGGFLLCGILLLIVSIPFFSFPKVRFNLNLKHLSFIKFSVSIKYISKKTVKCIMSIYQINTAHILVFSKFNNTVCTCSRHVSLFCL